ncbi:sulfotransferase [Sphingomonas sp. TX0543]|uniref:tetratricopeptide repeat-containing sulfotransferase family protein n=1 Tax=unclassified Sphingomonas TaxID=196159 RepID=UPI0010F71FA3|nr:sulfotransferase [Sphingomonas sp. 3P27F8]
MSDLTTTQRLADLLAPARAAAAPLRAASHLHARLATILGALGHRAEAVSILDRAAQLAPGRAEDFEALGFAAFGLGEHERSNAFYAAFTLLAPGDSMGWYNLATSQRNLGQFDQAAHSCERALAQDPANAQAALLRAHVRTQSAARNNVDDLRRRLSSQAAPAARIFLHYALGKELDDLADHDAAWEEFRLGAAARRASLRYDIAEDVGKLARIAQAFDRGRLGDAPPLEPGVRHAFVIGLPRSGTTLVERILTGAKGVRSNGETDMLLASLMAGTPQQGGDIFDRVARADGPVVRADYARRAGAEAALVIEKLPLNYLYAGAIRLTMPDARLILLKRCAGDNLFAMFSTLFGGGYPFSYALPDLATYYVAYSELMSHWRTVLGDQLLEVGYEDLVERPAEVGEGIARHAGIGWQERMVRVEENASATATASAAQVRRPIYRSAVKRWHAYRRQLAPLAAALEKAGIDIDANG